MKKERTFLSWVIAIGIGVAIGWFLANQRTRVAIISGPYSDNYGAALSELASAKAKLLTGDTNVLGHLNAAEAQINAAQQWTRRFLNSDDTTNTTDEKS